MRREFINSTVSLSSNQVKGAQDSVDRHREHQTTRRFWGLRFGVSNGTRTWNPMILFNFLISMSQTLVCMTSVNSDYDVSVPQDAYVVFD
jgi:hypothetical protein